MASRLPSLPLPVWNAGRCFWILTRSEDLSAFLFFCVPRRLILGAAPHCHQTSRSPPGFYFRVGILAALVWCGLMKTHKKKKKKSWYLAAATESDTELDVNEQELKIIYCTGLSAVALLQGFYHWLTSRCQLWSQWHRDWHNDRLLFQPRNQSARLSCYGTRDNL